jgi:serine/threonine-protein kinase
MTDEVGQAGVRPGDVLAGKYRVERVLGVGGMGVVVAAWHEQLETRVALKFLLPDALGNPEAVNRFLREARAAVKITGEHVARVSDVGQLENGAPYIVMEYLEGLDLAAWLQQRGSLRIDMAVDFLLQACEAIADAHTLGIVHRDLKPANLFCVQRSDGQLSIKVLDFGISKVTTPGGSNDMTRTTALVGSPYYMSPEQLLSAKMVDARTDIWSLGIILFELISGRVPFKAEAVTELALRIAMDPTPAVRTFRGDVPPGLELALSRCLEKDRERRFQNVGELAVAVREFGGEGARASVDRILGTLRRAGIGGLAGPPPAPAFQPTQGLGGSGSQPAVSQIGGPHTAASWGQTGAGSKSGAMALALGIGAALLLVVVVAVVLVVRKPGTSSATHGAAASGGPSTTAAATTQEPASPAASVEPSAPSAETVTLAPPATASAAPAVASVAPTEATVAPAAPTKATTGAAGAPTHAAAKASAAPAKANCDPPYYYNAKGTRVFKQECL